MMMATFIMRGFMATAVVLLLVVMVQGVVVTQQSSTSSLRSRRDGGRRPTTTIPNNNTCPGLEDISQALPFQDLHRAAISAKLSSLVYTLDDYNDDNEKMEQVDYTAIDPALYNPVFYESADGVDGVFLTNYDNQYCMAVYRGTQPELLESGGREDWLSNVDLRESTVKYNGAATCHVHRGYHEAYTKFGYRTHVEQYLKECQQSCGPSCDIVMTGHSQGGSIAVVAAIEWMMMMIMQDDDTSVKQQQPQQQQSTTVPYVVTFGAPQGLGTGCRGLLEALGSRYYGQQQQHHQQQQQRISCQWFHYIMSTAGAFGLTYDAVPMVFPHLLKGLAAYAKGNGGVDDDDDDQGFAFLGHELLVSTQQVDSILYIGLDEHRFDMPYSARAHWDWLYRDVMMDLLAEAEANDYTSYHAANNANDTDSTTTTTTNHKKFMPTHGFSLGSLCNVDQECISHRCQREYFLGKSKCV